MTAIIFRSGRSVGGGLQSAGHGVADALVLPRLPDRAGVAQQPRKKHRDRDHKQRERHHLTGIVLWID